MLRITERRPRKAGERIGPPQLGRDPYERRRGKREQLTIYGDECRVGEIRIPLTATHELELGGRSGCAGSQAFERHARQQASDAESLDAIALALGFAMRQPEYVLGLILDGPPDEIGEQDAAGEGDFSVDEFRRLAQDEGVDAFRRVWRAHPLMKLHTGDIQVHALVEMMLGRYPGRDLLEPGSSPAQPIGAQSLERFRKPVLVVNGQFDTRARLQAGERLRQSLPLAERVLIPDAGHLPNLDNPVAYNEAIQTFLRRQSQAAA